jgi:DNA-binding beta-propeller fold protein YncE
MKRALPYVILLFLLSVPRAFAEAPAPSYVELADAPTITVDWTKGTTQAVTLHGNFTTNGVNVTQSGLALDYLNNADDCATYDPATTHLFVCDTYNNRVMIFDGVTLPIWTPGYD